MPHGVPAGRRPGRFTRGRPGPPGQTAGNGPGRVRGDVSKGPWPSRLVGLWFECVGLPRLAPASFRQCLQAILLPGQRCYFTGEPSHRRPAVRADRSVGASPPPSARSSGSSMCGSRRNNTLSPGVGGLRPPSPRTLNGGVGRLFVPCKKSSVCFCAWSLVCRPPRFFSSRWSSGSSPTCGGGGPDRSLELKFLGGCARATPPAYPIHPSWENGVAPESRKNHP
jgi:hypothetical protein